MSKTLRKNKSSRKNKISKKNVKHYTRKYKLNKMRGGSNNPVVIKKEINFSDKYFNSLELDNLDLENTNNTLKFIKNNLNWKNLNNNNNTINTMNTMNTQKASTTPNTPNNLNTLNTMNTTNTLNTLNTLKTSNTRNNTKNTKKKKLLEEYIEKLTLSEKEFEKLIYHNYIKGQEAIKWTLDSEKYIISLHGSTFNTIFKLPDNINIIFEGPLRYLNCGKIDKNNSISVKNIDDYLNNPFCTKDESQTQIFNQARIYYGGQYCIDIALSRDNKKQGEFVSGIHYMEKTETNYKVNPACAYKSEEIKQLLLSEFLNNFLNNNLNNTDQDKSTCSPILRDKKYTLIFYSCRETTDLEWVVADTLVFYEQCIQRLNFKVNYDSKTNNSSELNINSNYKNCKTPNPKLYMKEKLMTQGQEYRNNSKQKGYFRGRNNTNNNITDKTIIVGANGKNYTIAELKQDFLNFIIHIETLISSGKSYISNDKEAYFNKLMSILWDREQNDIKYLYKINIDTKPKIKIIELIFDDKLMLLLEFLIYYQMNLIKIFNQWTRNRIDYSFEGSKVLFLNVAFNMIKALKHLDLSTFNTKINLDIFIAIDKYFKNKLTDLDLSFNKDYYISNQLGSVGALKLADVLKGNTKLITLNIDNNNMGGKNINGVIALLLTLPSLTSLTTLIISSNNIGFEGATQLAKVLNFTNIKTLNISNNNIKEIGFIPLAEALNQNSIIEELDISANQITISDINKKVLVDAFKNNKKMINLNISFNSIGNNGAESLAEALVNNKLKSLNISSNNIESNGVGDLAEALKINTSLTSLDISYNKFGDEGIIALAAALISLNTALTTLDIISSNIGFEGAQALAEVLKVPSTKLTTLNMNYNKIGDEGAKVLVNALKDNKNLEILNITGNRINNQIELLKILETIIETNKTFKHFYFYNETSLYDNTGELGQLFSSLNKKIIVNYSS